MARLSQGITEEVVDVEKLAQDELSRLERQFRIILNDRDGIPRDSMVLLKKQEDIIDMLEKEKEDLLLNITVSKSSTHERRYDHQQKLIGEKLAVLSKTLSLITLESLQAEELEQQIGQMEKTVKKMRMKDTTDYQSKIKAIQDARDINVLENRLHQVTVRFNEMLAVNAKLRNQITHLLNERTQFNILYQQLITRLTSGKKAMLDLIEQATIAYDQRQEAQNKLQVLKVRGRQDLLVHSQEMRELQRKMDHDLKLQEFLGVKGQRRILTDLESREASKKQHRREESERLTEKYEGILQQIRECCGEDDIDKLAHRFVKEEEDNFALFTYVNELHNELQSLQDEVEDLRTKIDDERVLEEHRREQQEHKLMMLQEQLFNLHYDMDDADERLAWSNRMLTNLLNGIERMFHLIRCDSKPLLDLLGPNSHTSVYNVLLYLGIIERRTNDLLNTVYLLDKKGKDAAEERYIAEVMKKMETKAEGLEEGEEGEKGEEEPEEETPFVPILKDTVPSKLRPVAIEVMTPTQPCILCVEQEEIQAVEEMVVLEVYPFTREDAKQKLLDEMDRPDFEDRLHNVSDCRMPRARRMMQNRYE